MQAGVASIDITPTAAVHMAGYAARTGKSTSVYHPLKAKALALQDAGRTCAVVTTDLIGFDRDACTEVKDAIERRTGLRGEQVILSASHTHTGPEMRVGDWRRIADEDDAEYWEALLSALAEVVERAASDLHPVQCEFATASCTLAANRRLPTETGVVMRPNPAGVTDPVVSVLTLRSDKETPLAVMMSYPCHPTTLGDYLIGGDYPGFAQSAVEAALPGCTALFMQGCGGDQKVRNVDGQGRFRSGPWEVARSLGEELARAVLLALGGPTTPVQGELQIAMREVAIPLQTPPDLEQLRPLVDDSNRWRADWAREMIRLHERGGSFPDSETFTLQVLSLGDFALVALSGEVCVGYSLRLKAALAPRPAIIAAYCNGMVGYIATAAMIPEGGYEVDSYFYRMAPAAYAPQVEDIIVSNAMAMAR